MHTFVEADKALIGLTAPWATRPRGVAFSGCNFASHPDASNVTYRKLR